MKEVFGAFKKKFGASSLEDACSRLSDLEMRVFLMLLHVLLPQLPIPNLSNAEKFQTLEDLAFYLNALITSGVAADEAKKFRGVIYVLGKSESGKTSFVKTLKEYIDHPTNQPKAILTKRNIDMHTQILEVSDVKAEDKRKLLVKLKQIGGYDNTSKLVSFIDGIPAKEKCNKEGKYNLLTDIDEEGNESNKRRVALKLVDYGGHEVSYVKFLYPMLSLTLLHQEYESCSSLFMSEGGTFIIMVDSNLIIDKKTIEANYNCWVGSYVDRILEATSGGEDKPKIQLVVTKVTPNPSKDGLFRHLFDVTREHLAKKLNDSAYLVDHVLKFYHSDHITQQSLQEHYEKMMALCSNEEINPRPMRTNPTDWFAFRDKVKERNVVDFDELYDMLDEVKRERIDQEAPKLLGNLRKLSEVVAAVRKVPTSQTQTSFNTETEVCLSTSNRPSISEEKSKEDSRDLLTTPEERKKKDFSTPTTSNIEALIGGTVGRENNSHYQDVQRDDNADNDKEKREKKQEITTILTYLSHSKELLWFPTIEPIKELIIPNIEVLIRSMRLVINHNFAGAEMDRAKNDYEQMGVLTFKDFQTIFQNKTKERTNEYLDIITTWKMIKNLGGGCPLNQEANGDVTQEKLLFPFLSKKETKVAIANKEKDMLTNPKSICLEYTFDHNSASTNAFYRIVQQMMSCLNNNQVEVIQTFSQRAEDCNLGSTRGIRGSLVWPGFGEGNNYDFLLQEHLKSEGIFASRRCIRICVAPSPEEEKQNQVYKILEKIDNVFQMEKTYSYGSFICMACYADGSDGHFRLREDQFQSEKNHCTGDARHQISRLLKGEIKQQLLQKLQYPGFVCEQRRQEVRRSTGAIPRNGRPSTGSWKVTASLIHSYLILHDLRIKEKSTLHYQVKEPPSSQSKTKGKEKYTCTDYLAFITFFRI